MACYNVVTDWDQIISPMVNAARERVAGRCASQSRRDASDAPFGRCQLRGISIRHDTPADGGGSARISMDVSSLMRLLTSQEERVEWARHLVLEA